MWEYLSQQYNVTNKINFWGLNMKITLIFNGMPFRIVDAEEPGFFFFTVEDTYIPEDWHTETCYYIHIYEKFDPFFAL